ncbi:metallophosphatase domain-containing protein [Flavilitoribacter nigricans]|uniref:Metallophosphoesterase n=1 Tax=Flavilitoribacter nigricans (strain ATCC 23147 / DSM 23189 / NBRC 102662 / NCIMB 1420 / SS-2) TaxID=1122177 RepID=A0A2D0MXU7_FLAN2|nr:metallophosphatase domain-containing protein [Flavilitoribacter nigricans]PHN01102.1 metallophosphoesterase [Flavilitoribacter nigricans DSM 23189 = NBRC 102662]
MKFVAISDTHGLHRNLSLPEGDVIMHGGDFCDLGKEAQVHDFLDWYDSLDFAHKIFIAGNHDLMAADEPRKFRSLIPEGITYLEDSGITIGGIQIWGSPYQPDLIGWAFGRPRGAAMQQHWDLIPESTDLLLTHTPPQGILDQSSSGLTLGCEELKQRLAFIRPRVHVFGHIHAAYGQDRRDGIHFINASNINSRHGLVNEAVTFEW